MLNSFSTKSPPFHVTLGDSSPPLERLEGRPDLGTSTRSRPGRRPHGHVRDPSGRTFQPFMGTRTGPTIPPASHPPVLVAHPLTTPPVQPLHRQMRIGAAHRELARIRGEVFLPLGYSLVLCTLWLQCFTSTTLPAGAHLWYRARDGLGGWARWPIAARPTIFPPTPTSPASSMTRDRSRSTSRHHLTPLHGTPSTDPGAFIVIRLGGWLAVFYGVPMGPAEPPLSPLSKSRIWHIPYSFNVLCFCLCFRLHRELCGIFRVYYNFVVSVMEPLRLL